jgi:hypothetical protein
MTPATVLESFQAIVNETPYWLREVHGTLIIDDVRKFILDNGGDQPRQKDKKEQTIKQT